MDKYCYFCGSKSHTCIKCDIENKMAPFFKIEIGIKMEEFITENINCQECGLKELIVLGNYTPSLDLVCKNCNAQYEVKSKCLSIKNLPNNIYCNGGNYTEFTRNINNGLNLIIVIYGVDRKKKEIIIRNIYYAPNNILSNTKYVEINKTPKSSLSLIKIPNRNILKNIYLYSNKIISFEKLYHNIKNII
jgi:hypothetical protein